MWISDFVEEMHVIWLACNSIDCLTYKLFINTHPSLTILYLSSMNKE